MQKILQEKDMCPKCGNEFSCSKSKSCWCYAYDVNTEVMEKLADEYDSCLCPECIEKSGT